MRERVLSFTHTISVLFSLFLLLPLELKSDRPSAVDQHIEPAAGTGQRKPIVGRARAPMKYHQVTRIETLPLVKLYRYSYMIRK